MTGTVKDVMDEVTFDSGFNKREFVVTTEEDRYPQEIKFECVKDRTALLSDIKEGQRMRSVRPARQRVQGTLLRQPVGLARHAGGRGRRKGALRRQPAARSARAAGRRRQPALLNRPARSGRRYGRCRVTRP